MKKKGFTLTELLIALVILGVIATFTIPKVLQNQQNSKKWALFKEDIAACQQAVSELVDTGQIQQQSHACNANSPVVSTTFDNKFNYLSASGNLTDRTYSLTNGGTIAFHQGNLIDFTIDYDGPNSGTNTFGDDKVTFSYNDCVALYNGELPVGHFGTLSINPAGFITENRTLWASIFSQ